MKTCLEEIEIERFAAVVLKNRIAVLIGTEIGIETDVINEVKSAATAVIEIGIGTETITGDETRTGVECGKSKI
ncbi:hypothetical protein [Virgibacillus oceani]|nr:hypothetical protein [Virgibacillus oceani]